MPDDSMQRLPARNPFADLAGVQLLGGELGHCHAVLDAGEQHTNPNGVVHGGAIYTLADTSMGTALMLTLPDGEYCATIEIKITYYAPAKPGRLTCHAHVAHKTRRFAFLDAEVRQEQHVIARASGTFAISRPHREHPAAGGEARSGG